MGREIETESCRIHPGRCRWSVHMRRLIHMAMGRQGPATWSLEPGCMSSKYVRCTYHRCIDLNSAKDLVYTRTRETRSRLLLLSISSNSFTNRLKILCHFDCQLSLWTYFKWYERYNNRIILIWPELCINSSFKIISCYILLIVAYWDAHEQLIRTFKRSNS